MLGWAVVINGVETVQTPLRTLENEAGDCDDKSLLTATLLETFGFSTRALSRRSVFLTLEKVKQARPFLLGDARTPLQDLKLCRRVALLEKP